MTYNNFGMSVRLLNGLMFLMNSFILFMDNSFFERINTNSENAAVFSVRLFEDQIRRGIR